MKIAYSLCTLLALASGAGAQTYQFTINAATSTNAATVNGNASFVGSFTGNYNQTTNPTGTRVLNFSIFGIRPPPPTNLTKTFDGTGTASGSPSTRPTGAYRLAVDLGGTPTVTLSDLDTNLVGTSAPIFPLNTTVRYDAFLSASPDNSYPFITPISLPLGDASITELRVRQLAPASGTLTPSGPSFTFSLSVNIEISGQLLLLGSPSPITPLPDTLTITGVFTPGTAPSATLNFSTSRTQTNNTPTPTPPTPIALPDIFGSNPPANLIATTTINSTSVTVGNTASLPAAGVPVCCVDFNNDGELDFSDIEGFLGALAAMTSGDCAPGADFNNDGEFDFSDIERFLSLYNAGC